VALGEELWRRQLGAAGNGDKARRRSAVTRHDGSGDEERSGSRRWRL